MIRKYDFVNTINAVCIKFRHPIYIYIVYYGLFHPYHDKSTFSFVWTVQQKRLPACIRSSSLCLNPNWKGCKLCVESQTIDCTPVFTVFVYLPLCATIFIYKAPAYTDPLNGHQLILQCWSPKCVCGYVQDISSFWSFTPSSIQLNRQAVTARIDSVHTH